jgi:hypothetical protein
MLITVMAMRENSMKPLHRAALDISVLMVFLVGLFAATQHKDATSDRSLKHIEQICSQRIALMEPYLQLVQQKAGGAGSTEILQQAFNAAKRAMNSSSQSPSDFVACQDALSESLSRLAADSRIYPRLMADRSFQTLHERLDETEAILKTALNEYTLLHHLDASRNKTMLDRIGAKLSFSQTSPAAIMPGGENVRIVVPSKPNGHLAAGFPAAEQAIPTVAME